jgi:hypothetical protein
LCRIWIRIRKSCKLGYGSESIQKLPGPTQNCVSQACEEYDNAMQSFLKGTLHVTAESLSPL